jgi:hypothetical protein
MMPWPCSGAVEAVLDGCMTCHDLFLLHALMHTHADQYGCMRAGAPHHAAAPAHSEGRLRCSCAPVQLTALEPLYAKV